MLSLIRQIIQAEEEEDNQDQVMLFPKFQWINQIEQII